MRCAADRQQKTLRPEGWVRRVRAAAGSAVVGCAPTKYDDLLHASHSNPSLTPPDVRLTYWIASPLLGHGFLRSRPVPRPDSPGGSRCSAICSARLGRHRYTWSMRAIHATTAGGPEVLTLVDLPDTPPGPDEIRVEVAAAGVNFIDTYLRSGVYPTSYPHVRSEEHTSELQSRGHLVCRLLLAKKKNTGTL